MSKKLGNANGYAYDEFYAHYWAEVQIVWYVFDEISSDEIYLKRIPSVFILDIINDVEKKIIGVH